MRNQADEGDNETARALTGTVVRAPQGRPARVAAWTKDGLRKIATAPGVESTRRTTLIIAGSLCLLYLATLTADYYWDGITFSLQIEKVAGMERGADLLLHPNHLLYNALCYLPYFVLRVSGIHIRALYVLQGVNALAGAVAVGVLFRIAEQLIRDRYAALISAAALAFSAVWWKIATDADAYVLSLLLVLICFETLLSSKPRWLLAGLAFAGAALVHQLASLVYPAALVAVFTNVPAKERWPFAAKFTALALGIPVTVYTACTGILYDARTPLAVIKWAVSNPAGVSLSANPLNGLKLFPRYSLDMIFEHSFALYGSPGGVIAELLALAMLIAAACAVIKLVGLQRAAQFLRCAFGVASARANWRKVTLVLITWIGAYVVFLLFWEPWQVLYRAFYLPPLALLLGLALHCYHKETRSLPAGAAALVVMTLALFNLAFYIAPHMRVTANPLIAVARDARKLWNGKTVVYYRDRNEADTAFEYFNNQVEWRRLTGAGLGDIDAEIQRECLAGGHVWFNKGAAESADIGWLTRRSTGREIALESPNASARYVELHSD